MVDKKLNEVNTSTVQKVLGINGTSIVAETFDALFTRGGNL